MSEDDHAMLTGVRQWLEGGGYVLEMRVARSLARLRLPIEQGYAYTDVDTGKERAGDIGALMDADTLDDYWHMLDLVIECKSTTAPWIGFSRLSQRRERPMDRWRCDGRSSVSS